MKKIVCICIFFGYLCAKSTTDCTAVFEQRKSELLKQIEKIDEARQAEQALKAANNALFERKMKALKKEQAKNEDILKQIKQENEKLAKLNAKKSQLIASINDIKKNKLSETYNKMKDGAAAGILEKMSPHEAASILFVLSPKKVSKIMAKMQAKIASEVSLLLKKGPPFKEN